MLNNDRTVRIYVLAVVITSPTVHLNETEEGFVCSSHITARKNLVYVELCYIRRFSLETCKALAVQPALATKCGVSKIVSAVGCLELELVVGCLIVLANKLSSLGKSFLAACCYSKRTVVVVDVVLILAPNSCEGIHLTCLGKNDFSFGIVSIKCYREDATCCSSGVCLGCCQCSLECCTCLVCGCTYALISKNSLCVFDKGLCLLALFLVGVGESSVAAYAVSSVGNLLKSVVLVNNGIVGTVCALLVKECDC